VFDAKTGIELLPDGVSANNGAITRDGRKMLVQANLDNNPLGISSMALWDSRSQTLSSYGNLNGSTCGGSGESGPAASYGWALDDLGKKAVGTGYLDLNGNGYCEDMFDANWNTHGGEVVPFIWTKEKGPHELSMDGIDLGQTPWLRAQAISGDGSVVLGNSNFQNAYAWINEGKPIDLTALVGAYDGYAMSRDGSRVALSTYTDTLLFWNAKKGTKQEAFTKPASLLWCTDIPLVTWFEGDLCALYGAEAVQAAFGPVPVSASDMSDDGAVVIGRAGDFFIGFTGVMWLERLGWVKLSDFFHQQGVAEAYRYGLDNPIAISGNGAELVGGIPGISFTWYVDMKQAFVCDDDGRSKAVRFPEEYIEEVREGARPGRCEIVGAPGKKVGKK
jgi:hypothetical protein